MNWQITGEAAHLGDIDVVVEHAEREDPDTAPDKKLTNAARKAATALAAQLGGDTHVEIRGHETTKGRGFKPAHVTVSVSRLDPKR